MIYEPSDDSFLLEKEVIKYVKGKSFLDMGSGSGIQVEAAKKAGATRVLAVDKYRDVISSLKKKGINAKQSDLFSKVTEKFDVIAFNPPYLPEDDREDAESQRITTGGKQGDELLLAFLKGCKAHLTKNGSILVVVSSLTPLSRIDAFLRKNALTKRIIAREKHFMEQLEVWLLRRKSQ